MESPSFHSVNRPLQYSSGLESREISYPPGFEPLTYQLSDTDIKISEIAKIIKDHSEQMTEEEILAGFDALSNKIFTLNNRERKLKEINENAENYEKNVKSALNILIDQLRNTPIEKSNRFYIVQDYNKIRNNLSSTVSIKNYSFLNNLFFARPLNLDSLSNRELVAILNQYLSYRPNKNKQLSMHSLRLKDLTNVILKRNDFKPDEMIEILNAHLKTKKLNLKLFKHLEKVAIEQKSFFSTDQIKNLLIPFANLGIRSEALLKEFLRLGIQYVNPTKTPEEIERRELELMAQKLKRADKNDLIRILRCYCVFKPKMDIDHELLPFFNSIIARLHDSDLFKDTKTLTQMYQVYLACQALGIEKKIEWPVAFIQAKDRYVVKKGRVSGLQEKANLLMQKMGYQFPEWKIEQPIGPFKVDLLNEDLGIVIEIDGQPHFVEGNHRFGRDAMKNWVLKGLGFEILRVTEDTVDKLGSDDDQIRRGTKKYLTGEISKLENRAKKRKQMLESRSG